MDSDENSPIVINLDSYCRTPLTSQENKTYERARKINLKEKQWSRKPMKTVSKYSCAFEELLEDGKASEFLVCKIFGRIPSNRYSLCVAHEKVGTLCESRTVTPSRIGIAQAVRDRATGREEQQEYKGLLERIKISGAICYDFGKNKREHVLTENFLLRPFIVHFGEWSGSEKTRKTVTKYIHDLLIKKGAASGENVTQIGRTTDEGQNVLSGGEERFLHVRCLCHVLATIARRTTDPYHGSRLSVAEKRQLNQFSDQLKELSKFVTTAKNIPQIDDIAGSFLLESVCTRWLTNHMMCREFHEGIDKIKEAVAQHGDDSLKADLAALSVAKSPTINLVLPVLAKFELHIQLCSDDQGEERRNILFSEHWHAQLSPVWLEKSSGL
ncbi:hypothetical protein niasHT_037120 [Heterodera trifolii]|uniref:Uncharacterized protein n=1 Tax=Heterodera trifolii TaxID=157864 RepID=A0ABD2IJK5_9BILA